MTVARGLRGGYAGWGIGKKMSPKCRAEKMPEAGSHLMRLFVTSHADSSVISGDQTRYYIFKQSVVPQPVSSQSRVPTSETTEPRLQLSHRRLMPSSEGHAVCALVRSALEGPDEGDPLSQYLLALKEQALNGHRGLSQRSDDGSSEDDVAEQDFGDATTRARYNPLATAPKSALTQSHEEVSATWRTDRHGPCASRLTRNPFASQTTCMGWRMMGWTTNPQSPTTSSCTQIPATKFCSRPRLMRRTSNVSFAWHDEDSAAAGVERGSASFSHYSYSASASSSPASAVPPPPSAGMPATVSSSGTTAAQHHHPHPPASPFRAFAGASMASASTPVIPTNRRSSVARPSSDTTLLASAPGGVSLRGSSISPPGSYGNPPIRPPTPLSGSSGGGGGSLNGRRRAFGVSSARSIDEGAGYDVLPVARSSNSFTQGTAASPSAASFRRLTASRISDGDAALVERHPLQPSLRPTSKQLADRTKVGDDLMGWIGLA